MLLVMKHEFVLHYSYLPFTCSNGNQRNHFSSIIYGTGSNILRAHFATRYQIRQAVDIFGPKSIKRLEVVFCKWFALGLGIVSPTIWKFPLQEAFLNLNPFVYVVVIFHEEKRNLQVYSISSLSSSENRGYNGVECLKKQNMNECLVSCFKSIWSSPAVKYNICKCEKFLQKIVKRSIFNLNTYCVLRRVSTSKQRWHWAPEVPPFYSTVDELLREILLPLLPNDILV